MPCGTLTMHNPAAAAMPQLTRPLACHASPPSSPPQERQRLHQCLRHSLNNVFQSSQFSSCELDAIADSLAPGRPPLPFLHPHRTLFMGNYDVNVLEVALRRHGKVGAERQWAITRIGGDELLLTMPLNRHSWKGSAQPRADANA